MAAFKIYLVALPIGNVDDLSPRARDALERASKIFCEDTRKFKDLCARSEIHVKAKLISMPGDREHDFDWNREFQDSGAGSQEHSWVLVSDAGTPVLNDPGRALIERAQKEKWELIAIPGPAAPVLAWQWSGGFGLPFVFAGFAPKANHEGSSDLDFFFSRAGLGGSFCFFDTRHQIQVTLKHLIHMGWGQRKLVIAREMTKSHEELLQGTVESLYETLEERLKKSEPIGELTLILESQVAPIVSQSASLEELLQIRTASPKQASKVLAKMTGLKSSEVYEKLLELKSASKGMSDEN